MSDLATISTKSQPAAARSDLRHVRADFPILATTNSHGKPVVYLDSAATSLKPKAVIDAVDGYNREYSSNIHRGIYEMSERATAAYEGARASVAKLINAP